MDRPGLKSTEVVVIIDCKESEMVKLELWNLTYTQWKTETLFSIQWWGMVALIAISYAIWWIIVDRRRLSQILIFGSLVASSPEDSDGYYWYQRCPLEL